MPKENDYYIIKLKESHLKDWGTHRYTNTRERIESESYIPIPKAEKYNILNNNQSKKNTIYTAKFKDTDVEIEVLASGSSKAGDKYAKQFHGKGNLKALTPGYEALGVQVGDEIKITFIDEKTFEVEKI